MKKLFNILLDKLKEKSTWGTILTIVASVTGCVISPELSEAITTAGLGIVSIIAILTKADKK